MQVYIFRDLHFSQQIALIVFTFTLVEIVDAIRLGPDYES